MLRFLQRLISSGRSSSGSMQTVLSQRHAASCVRSAANQARLRTCLPAAVAAQRQQISTLWRPKPFRQLHSTVACAAAASDADEADGVDSPVYEASYDVSYVCFTCIIGTATNVLHLTGSDGTPWIKFSVRVPTPNSETFTLWNCLCTGKVAKDGKDLIHEGNYLQVSGIPLFGEVLKKAEWDRLLPQPAIYAESLGYFADRTAADDVDHAMLPPLSKADLDTFIKSGGQQLYAPGPTPPELPASVQPAAGPISVPGMPDRGANEIEEAWISLFSQNHLWVDQRATKKGKQPDFKLREKATDGRKDALWITDSRLPQWVKRNLQLLPGGIPFSRPVPDFIPAGAADGDPIEQQWVEVFANYAAFWDNRKNKTNPRAPDFSPKDRDNGGTALWIEDRRTPQWVHDNMNALPAAPETRR